MFVELFAEMVLLQGQNNVMTETLFHMMDVVQLAP